MSFIRSLKTTLEMIKFEHTIFALPFAFLGAIFAAQGMPTAHQIVWIVVAMVGARSAAMSFNRIVDRDIDRDNPRTANREIPSGKLSLSFAWTFMIVSSLVFFVAAYMLNELTLWLSPVALISILGYSYAKRFTTFAHLILGWSLAIAPTGAWIAVTGTLRSEIPILLSLFVLMWTTGFDILYSCQDAKFDRENGLWSIPAKVGIPRAMLFARIFHAQAFFVLVFLYIVTGLNPLALIGIFGAGALMFYQHTLVKPNDLSRMNAAFFTANAFVSVVVFVGFGLAIFVG